MSSPNQPNSAPVDSTGSPPPRATSKNTENAQDVDHVSQFVNAIDDLRSAFAEYVHAKFERVRVSVRDTSVRLAIGVGAILVFVSLVAASTVFMLIGAALGIAMLAGGQLWVGYLSIGIFGIAGAKIAMRRLITNWDRTNLQKAQERYAARNSQRSTAGTDAPH